MKLSIIIATFKRSKSLEKCLASLIKQSFKSFEVIIIDGDSKDNTKNIVNKFSSKLKIKYLVYPDTELAEIRDFGWRNSKGEILAWIDDDVVCGKDWAGKAVEIFYKNERIGGVSGPTIIPDKILKNRDVFSLYKQNSLIAKIWKNYFCEGKWREFGRLFKSGAWSPGSNFKESMNVKKLIDVDYLEACNMFLRRDLVEKVDGYDLNFRGTAEWCELDLAIRVKKLKYRLVFSSRVNCEHHISNSGVYKNRVNAKVRMENFLLFYFRHVFEFKIDYIIRFIPYLFFLNIYWFYKFLRTRNYRWLGGVLGNLSGIWKMMVNYEYKNIWI